MATRRPFDALASPKIYSFRPCRVIRSLLETCPLCRLRRQRCVEAPHPTKDIEKQNNLCKRVNPRNDPSVSASPSRLPYRGSHNRSVVHSATPDLHISFSSSQHNRMASAGYKKIGCRVLLGSRLVLFLLFTSSSARAGGLRAGRATTPCSHSGQVYRRAQQDAPEQSSKWRGCRCSRAGRISPARSTRER